jgi:alpha,alpha-trehalose phosphorylase
MHSRRLVSFARRELLATHLTLVTDADADVRIRSRIVNRQDLAQLDTTEDDDPRRGQAFSHRVLEPRAATGDGLRFTQGWVTSNSGMGLICSTEHHLEGVDYELTVQRQADDIVYDFSFHSTSATAASMTKTTAYVVSDDAALVAARQKADQTVEQAIKHGFDRLAAEQREIMADFWRRADVQVEAGPEIQRAVRWTLFQLHQASHRLEGHSIPAKGLTGQAYDGHYFWDTEIYVMPFLTYTNPTRAPEILRFRHRTLNAARRRAAVLGHRGALFPWRTITGEEASAYFLAGTAQYHIDADIVYALKRYVELVGDDDLLWDIGMELVVETARMWADLGFYRGNRFHIHGVTGPDEYTALVDDSAYTNAMARMNLRFAAACAQRMRQEQPDRWAQIVEQLSITESEPPEWRRAADAMYIPYDSTLGITPQDDDFLNKEPWDFEAVPPSKYPLLLHFHPLTIYRFQVLKQADVVLADFLLGHEFSHALKKANFDYYDPITTGDSSLSASVQAIMAAEFGYEDAAMAHFEHALFMDLADLAGNTTDGVHMASAGGVWMALVYGFAGLRDHDGHLSFAPRLPRGWSRLAFPLLVRGARIEVELTPGSIAFESTGDLEVQVNGVRIELEPGQPVTVGLASSAPSGLIDSVSVTVSES